MFVCAVALYRSEHELHCVVRPPANGQYVLTLAGCHVSRDNRPHECPVARLQLSVSGAVQIPRPFPCADGEYGPQLLAVQCGLWTSADAGRIDAPFGAL